MQWSHVIWKGGFETLGMIFCQFYLQKNSNGSLLVCMVFSCDRKKVGPSFFSLFGLQEAEFDLAVGQLVELTCLETFLDMYSSCKFF